MVGATDLGQKSCWRYSKPQEGHCPKMFGTSLFQTHSRTSVIFVGVFFHPCLGISICENSSLRAASSIYIMTTLTELENFQNFRHIQKYLIYSQSLPCVCVRARKRLCPDRPVLLQSRTWLCCSVCTHNHADLETSRCLHASCAGLGKTNGECWETTVFSACQAVTVAFHNLK